MVLLQGPFQRSLMVLLLFLHMRAEHMAPSLSVNAFPLLGMEKHLYSKMFDKDAH